MNGSRTTTIRLETPMIPTQPQPTKRKATEDANPLAATGKKVKREVREQSLCLSARYIVFMTELESRSFQQAKA